MPPGHCPYLSSPGQFPPQSPRGSSLCCQSHLRAGEFHVLPWGIQGQGFWLLHHQTWGSGRARCVWRGHPLAPRWLRVLRSSLGSHLPASFPAPSGRVGAHLPHPAWAVLSRSGHKKEQRLRRRPPLRMALLHSPLIAPSSSSPPPTNWQNSCLKCTLGVDITMKNLQRTRRMPHRENGPLDLSPSNQSASPSPYPLPLHLFLPALLSSSPPPPFPLRSTNLGSGFHAQGVLKWGAEVTASLF